MITAVGLRTLVENKVDFSEPRNLITVGIALVLGAGNFKLNVAGFTLDGIGTATIKALATAGAHVVQLNRNEELSRKQRDEIVFQQVAQWAVP